MKLHILFIEYFLPSTSKIEFLMNDDLLFFLISRQRAAASITELAQRVIVFSY